MDTTGRNNETPTTMRALNGFCLGSERDVAKGEEFVVPWHQARGLLYIGHAELAEESKPESEPAKLPEPEGAVENRDPQPTTREPRAARR